MFSYGPLYMDMQVLANQLEQQLLCIDTGCCLEDLLEVMDDKDKWRESQGNPC